MNLFYPPVVLRSLCLWFALTLPLEATSAQIHNTAGLAFFYQGKYAQAFEEFLSALKKDPNNSVAHFNMGRVFEKQGKLKDAFIQFQRTLSLDPSHDGARRGYQRLIRFKEKTELRVQTREEILKEKIKKNDVRAQAARDELLAKRLKQIEELFSKREYSLVRDLITDTLQTFPESGDLHFYLARYYFIQELYSRSLEELTRALEFGVSEEDVVRYLLGLNYESLGDYTRAEIHLRKAVELAPTNGVYYERLGRVLKKLGKSHVALEELQEGVRVSPGNVQAQVELNKLSRELSLKTYHEGRLAFEQREYERAHKYLQRAIEVGQLSKEDLEEAKVLFRISDFWVRKSRRVKVVKENQRRNTQKIDLNQSVAFEDVIEAPRVYEGRYVSWKGVVVDVAQKGTHYEVLVDLDPENDFQEDLEMDSMVLLWVHGSIPQDQRLSYLGTVEFEGKYKGDRYLKNPFNQHYSIRRQPVVYLTDGKFRNESFGPGFLRVFPEVDYRDTLPKSASPRKLY